jgi:hypothetical protein
MGKTIQITTPAGTTGLACEPWTKGEIYAVAADWAQASSPVLVYGKDGWTYDEHGRQVADFRHNYRDALESILREAIEMGGDEPNDEEVEGCLDDAVEIDDTPEEVREISEVLDRHGGNAIEAAQGWADHGFDADDTDDWCEVGVWDADTAADLREAGLSPREAKGAAERLLEDGDADDYTDGDPIYSVCNGDTSFQELIDAAE